MGGHRLKQRNRPIKLFHERSENHYQELVKKTVGLTGVGITVLTREKKWTLVKKDVATKDNVINVVRAFTRQVAIAMKKNNKVTRILGSLGFLVFKSLGLAESGGNRFPWSTENNCNQSQLEATKNESDTKESRFVPLSKASFLDKYIRPKKKPVLDEFAGSYLEGVVGKLRKVGDMIKQHCNCCGDESEFYSKVESASYLCVRCVSVNGYPQ